MHHDALGRPAYGSWVGSAGRGTLYLYSERRTVKARSLAADPRLVVHLESGEDVLTVRAWPRMRAARLRSPAWSRP